MGGKRRSEKAHENLAVGSILIKYLSKI